MSSPESPITPPSDYQLERLKLAADIRLKRAELACRRAELAKPSQARLTASPLLLAIVAGTLSVLGGIMASSYQARQTIELERQKERHELIVKMISTDNPQQATRNLLFLVRAGFIADVDGKIASLAEDPKTRPVLPSLNGMSVTSDLLKNLPADTVGLLGDKPYSEAPERLRNVLDQSFVDGKQGEQFYEALSKEQRTRLWLLYSGASAVHLSDDRPLFDFVKRIMAVVVDRFFASVDNELLQAVQESERFVEVSGLLHQPPPGYELAGSFKVRDRKPPLHITFFRSENGDLIADIDFDKGPTKQE